MELVELETKTRTTRGNSAARALRRQDRIPAVLYGPDTETILLSVDKKELEQTLHNSGAGQVIFNLSIQNGKTITKSAMIKELQMHPVSEHFLHVDFYEIAMDRKIRIRVPVSTRGKSKGVELGGMLQIVRHELEVLCLPLETPETIELDISDLGIGDSIHLEDISLEGDIEFPPDVNFTVLTVASPKIEAEEEEEEEEELEEAEEGEEAEKEEESTESGDD